MAGYRLNVRSEDNSIILEATGHLDVPAGQHVLEVARIAVESLRRAVRIDLGGVKSSTPGAAHLLSARNLGRLHGQVTVRGHRSQRGPLSLPVA